MPEVDEPAKEHVSIACMCAGQHMQLRMPLHGPISLQGKLTALHLAYIHIWNVWTQSGLLYITACTSLLLPWQFMLSNYNNSTCDGTYRVILRIVKAGCHPVAIAQVVEH